MANSPADGSRAPIAFDYQAPAELYLRRLTGPIRKSLTHKRFKTAAEAISYVMEEIPDNQQAGVVMEVLERRFDHHAIATLARQPTGSAASDRAKHA